MGSTDPIKFAKKKNACEFGIEEEQTAIVFNIEKTFTQMVYHVERFKAATEERGIWFVIGKY